MADKTYALDFTIHDPKTGTDSVKTVTFTVPQGPKGDTYGTFTKTVTNGKELESVLYNLASTQSIVGAYATIGSKDTQLVVLQYTKSQMVYAYSNNLDEYPDSPTAATWMAMTSPEGEAKFDVAGSYADSVTLYIYDPAARPTFLDLSGEADYQLYQGVMPGYNWNWNSLNPPALSTVSKIRDAFVYGSQDLEAGKSYLALFGGYDLEGLRASVFTVGSDGTSVTWDAGKRWEIPFGAQIRMPNGAVYLAVAKPTAGNTPIYDCVKPVSGKIPLTYSNKTIVIANMENVAVYLKPVDSSQEARIIFDRGNKNLTMYLDTSEVSSYAPELRVSKDEYGGSPLCAGTPLIPSQNNSFDIGFNQRAYRPILVYNGSTSGEFSPTFQTNPFNNFNSAGSVTYLSLKKLTNTEEGGGKNVITLDDGSKRVVRYNVVWNFDEFGGMTSTPLVCFDPYEETATASMAPAKAMALSLSAEPGMSQEDFEKIIEGKKGIFTVKDGMAYDLLTGEYLM